MTPHISPKLIVSDPDAAADFYVRSLGASVTIRAEDDGIVNHVELAVGASTFALGQAVTDWGWNDPPAVGGSPVLITVEVADPDALADRMATLGAEVVIPVDDRGYGKRQGRLRDPFGHLWIISGDTT
ncbi:VOC family protein [Tsukamurella paurometabola]|nr:VOC family protein [Tsukamurella paurometabola]MBS4100415.1 VOC family protein [Tsukamurella paurometabola]UEA83870.1 VOC family protein [Tsukamurella paurometabola]